MIYAAFPGRNDRARSPSEEAQYRMEFDSRIERGKIPTSRGCRAS